MAERMDEFVELEDFLRRVPGIDTSMRNCAMGKGRFENGNWWIKFSIDIDHPLAWNVVQELGNVLNYLSVAERLPTRFMPVSPPSYLNGGPRESLSWVIESTIADFSPKTCAEWLAGRLPQPVEDMSQWPSAEDVEEPPPEIEDESSSLASERRPPDLEDCEAIGQEHKWYNMDDVSSACYKCRVVRPGQLWRR